jgi:hypothetical protein
MVAAVPQGPDGKVNPDIPAIRMQRQFGSGLKLKPPNCCARTRASPARIPMLWGQSSLRLSHRHKLFVALLMNSWGAMA